MNKCSIMYCCISVYYLYDIWDQMAHPPQSQQIFYHHLQKQHKKITKNKVNLKPLFI